MLVDAPTPATLADRPTRSLDPDAPDDGPGGVASTLYDASVGPSWLRLAHEAVHGRYLLVRELGRGGMAVVLLAYDERLDRRVAIKVLRDGVEAGATARARMLREARALARLSHPNVVQVYDVGEHAGDVFLAMEYVEGVSLREWLAAEPRGWAAVVEVFLQVGEGLRAAHREGLVHRDLKPSNVIVDATGRARVLDFGLARARSSARATGSAELDLPVHPAPPDPAADPVLAGDASRSQSMVSCESTLTMGDTIVGTPVYMAPEQARAQAVDARSDQFAFCVMLYHALYGTRPFAGTTLRELLASIDAQAFATPHDDHAPAWLRPVVLRGLRAQPEHRWPDMDALLGVLRRDPARRRRRLLALVGLPSVAMGVVMASHGLGAREPPTCGTGEERWSAIWNEGVRNDAEAGLLATGLGYAPESWARARDAMDGYLARWSSAYADTCHAHQRGEVSSALADQQVVCLHARLAGVEALTQAWAHADAAVVERAASAITRLGDPATCRDPAALLGELPSAQDPAHAAAVGELRAKLGRVEGLRHAGRLPEAVSVAESLVTEAHALGERVVVAEAELAHAMALDETGRYPQAEAALEAALWASIATGHLDVHAEAASNLVLVVGQRQARYDDATRWIEHAHAALERRGSEALWADFERRLSGVELGRGHLEDALAHLRRAAELSERHGGPDNLGLASALANQGMVLEQLARYDEARASLERAMAIRARVLGPAHPEHAMGLYALASIDESTGDYPRAIERFGRAAAQLEASLGPEHLKTAIARFGLASAVHFSGDSARALPMLEAAVAAFTTLLGPRHPNVAIARNNLGLALLSLDRRDEARAAFEASRDLAIEISGPRHVDVARAWGNLGLVQLAEHDLDGAEHSLREGLAIYEEILGPDHVDLGYALTGLGRVALDRGHHADAVALLRRAERLRAKAPVEDLAQTRSYLAQALWEGDIDRAEARALAMTAMAAYTALGKDPREAALFVPPSP